MELLKPIRYPNTTTSRFLVLFSLAAYANVFLARWIDLSILGLQSASHRPLILVVSLCTGLAVTALYYVLHPIFWRRAFGGSVELTSGIVADRIEVLAIAAGVRKPRLWVDNDLGHCDALVFGIVRRPNLLMGRGMLLLAAKDMAAFDARIAHELGHVKSGDAALCYLARGLKYSILLLFVVGVALRFSIYVSDIARTWARAGGENEDLLDVVQSYVSYFTPLVVNDLIHWVPAFAFWYIVLDLEYRAFLRVREEYADAHAVDLVGYDGIARVLSAVPIVRPNAERLPLFDHHPSRLRRLSLLRFPDWVGSPRGGTFLWYGFLTGVMLDGSSQWVSDEVDVPIEHTGNDMEAFVSLLLSGDPSFNILFAALLTQYLVLLPFFFAGILLVLRVVSQGIGDRSSGRSVVFTSLSIALWSSVGFTLGHIFQPSLLSTRFTAFDFSISFTSSFSLFYRGPFFFLLVLYIALFAFLPLRMMTSPCRLVPLNSLSWLSLTACLVFPIITLGSFSVARFGPFTSTSEQYEFDLFIMMLQANIGFYIFALAIGFVSGRYWRRWTRGGALK